VGEGSGEGNVNVDLPEDLFSCHLKEFDGYSCVDSYVVHQ